MAATLHFSFFKGFYYYSPWVESENWPFLKGSNISETGEVTPTKIGVYELDINPYLHEFFELILTD